MCGLEKQGKKNTVQSANREIFSDMNTSMTIKSGQRTLVSTHRLHGEAVELPYSRFLGQSKGTVLVPGTRRLKRKFCLVFLSLEALTAQTLICRLAVPPGSHELQLCRAEGALRLQQK